MYFICDICHKSTGSLYSELIAEIREKNDNKENNGHAIDTLTSSSLGEKSKMAHIECCSIDQIKKMLLSQADDQIMFYKDILDMVNGVTRKEEGEKREEDKQDVDKSISNKMSNFEQKYGSFNEARQGTRIDHNLLSYALIAELKRRNR